MDLNAKKGFVNFPVFHINEEKSRTNSVEGEGFRIHNPTLLDKGGLALSTFFAANHPVESCGSNGLPLTPNSVQILGRFHRLTQLYHQNLCAYVQICRIHHGMLQTLPIFKQYLTYQFSYRKANTSNRALSNNFTQPDPTEKDI